MPINSFRNSIISTAVTTETTIAQTGHTGSGSGTDKVGIKITPSTTFTLTEVEVFPNDTSTYCGLYLYSDKSLLASAAIAAKKATFNYVLTAGVSYIIASGNGENRTYGWEDEGISPDFPITLTKFSIPTAVYNNGSWNDYLGHCWSIYKIKESITTTTKYTAKGNLKTNKGGLSQ